MKNIEIMKNITTIEKHNNYEKHNNTTTEKVELPSQKVIYLRLVIDFLVYRFCSKPKLSRMSNSKVYIFIIQV